MHIKLERNKSCSQNVLNILIRDFFILINSHSMTLLIYHA